MTQLILVAFSIFAIDSFTYAVGPANILECFGAAKDAAEIGAPPGTKNYLNFKCFDGNGPYTNACNLTIMGITSKADRYNYCLRGPPYVNLLSCCATCASKMKDDTSELGVRSLATLTAILAANQTCTNGIESIENQLAGANTCARMAQANPGMCAPTRYNMCRFAFFNCRAYCYSVNKAFGWCSYNGGAAMGTHFDNNNFEMISDPTQQILCTYRSTALIEPSVGKTWYFYNLVMNQSDINCTIAAELLGNWLFTTSVIVNFVTSLFAVVANLLLIVCFSSVSASHKNIRILSCNVSVACVVASLFYIGRAIAFWIQSINPCNLHITSSLCNLLSIPLNTSMSSLIISMIGIAMERARASIWHADYNLNSCRMSVGICLAAWLSYCWMLLLSLKIGAPQLADGPFCVSMIMTNMMPMLIVSFVIVFHGLVVLGVYLKLIAYNRLRLRNFAEKQSHLSLESRLEMRHTIEITSMFLPSVVAHTILWIGYAVILSTLIYELVQSEVQRYSVGVCMNDLASLFMAIHPIMLFGRSERLRTKLKILLAHMLKQKLSTTQVEVISRNGSDSEEYFKGLKWAWVHNSRSDGSVYKISQM